MKRMTILIAAVFALAALMVPAFWQADVQAAGGPGGKTRPGHACPAQGSYYGHTPFGTFLVTYHGTGSQEGTIDLEWVNFQDPTFGGAFSAVTAISSGRGVWKRTGPDTLKVMAVFFGRNDAARQIVYATRSDWTITFSDCDSFTISDVTIEIRSPDMQQLLLCVPPDMIPPMTGQRVVLEPLCAAVE